jgi:hypothetical protein
MNRIPLELFLNVIPKVKTSETGIKFNAICKIFQDNKIKGARRRNKVFQDLQYYVELGYFINKQHENTQPQFYQTNINDYDYIDDFVKPKLDEKFKTITDKWEKINKKKIFLKSKKPSKQLEKLIIEFDFIIAMTQNLMWSKQTMKNEILHKRYSVIIDQTIKEINKFAKLVHSTSKVKRETIQAVFSRIPFPIKF